MEIFKLDLFMHLGIRAALIESHQQKFWKLSLAESGFWWTWTGPRTASISYGNACRYSWIWSIDWRIEYCGKFQLIAFKLSWPYRWEVLLASRRCLWLPEWTLVLTGRKNFTTTYIIPHLFLCPILSRVQLDYFLGIQYCTTEKLVIFYVVNRY